MLDKIELNAKQPTNCVFGPNETIYITSASVGLTLDELEQFPDSGYLIEKKLIKAFYYARIIVYFWNRNKNASTLK